MKIKEIITGFFAENASFIFLVPAVLWQLFFLYVPLFLVLYMSFQHASAVVGVNFTLDHYKLILSSIPYFYIIGRSVFIAAGVTFLCLLCAYPIAYYLALKVSRRWKNVLLFLLTLPFWTNFLIQIYSWVFVLDHNGLINMLLLTLGIIQSPLYMINNTAAIFFVMLYHYLPFMIMPLYSILEKIQHDLLEASMDLGATHWQTFRRITFPLSMSGIKTGVFLVFVPAFGEFVIPSIIGGAHHLFVGSLISHYFLVTRDSQLGAAFTIVSGFVLLICALLFNWLCTVPLQKIQKKEQKELVS
ncbi:MAG TPA: ABC transporter permease [Candidatus Babeliales bacterium]|jgi:spermidine/putrescine transport system permease protein|nr:ABC transporter permease [Candidatus Babeliales bacterium]